MSALLRSAAACACLGLLLAGCASTGSGQYSSLPPAPRHPADGSPPEAQAETPPPVLPVAHLAPDEYTDILDRIRAGYALQDVQNWAIDKEVEGYRMKPDFLDRTFRRGARYLHYILGEIKKRGMPTEIALLPVVESAFNPVAYSRSRASGLWQFIPSSGKHYHLEQNWWIDQRRDVIESTQAALNYLQYLHDYFNGDWYLAIAAYNGGEGTVATAVARNAAAGRPTDFFSLDLRPETRDYVPKLLAMRRIVGNPEMYGLQFAPIPNTPYFAIVDPGRQVHLGEAADLAGISRDDMFALNPGFNRMTTPPNGPHRLLLPVDHAEAFRQAITNPEGTATIAVAAIAPPSAVQHTVHSGETLTEIARHYGVPADTLREANGLNGSKIHRGQLLLIPGAGGSATKSAAYAAPREDIAAQLPEHQAQASRKGGHTMHVVKPGETLWSVAKRYGVTVPALAAANNLSPQSGLTAGARLEIPGSRGAGGKETSTVGYTVRRGDTLSQIADNFGVSVRELMAWNRLKQSTSLRTGQRLLIHVDSNRQNGG